MIMPSDLNWQYCGSYSQNKQKFCSYRDFKRGLQKETVAAQNEQEIVVGETRKYFFIDGNDSEFRTEQELCDAYNKICQSPT